MEKEESIEKERRGRFFRAPFLIIALLLVIIAVGVVVILLTPKGNIPVTIESFSPEGEVPQTTNFTIEFSQDLATDSLLWGYLDRVPITFNPPIPGVFKWIARNKLRFFPETFLLPSTEYVAEVRPDIVTEENYYLKGKRRFSFHTSRFRVEEGSLSLQFGPEVKKEVMIVGQVRFNYPVELEELKRYMTILFEKGVSIPYQFVTQGASTSHRFESEPMEKWEEDQKIELRVNQGLKPVQGKLGLLHGYGNVFSFKGRGELVVERVFSEQREEFSSLKIKLNQVVAVEEAKSYITVDPAVEIQMLPEYQYLELRGDFKAGVGYTVTIKPGMMATDGSVLKKEFSTTVVLENLEPSIDFVGEGIYLSREGNLNLGLATINVEKVLIEIEKVYANNLIYLLHSNALRGRRGYYYDEDYYEDDYYYYSGDYNIRNLGRHIQRKEMDIESRLNEEVITPIALEEYLEDERIGIFSVRAYKSDQHWRSAQRWAMITDLGIMAKKTGNQLLVWVNSLSSLDPVRGAEVILMSRNNQTLLRGMTDSRGFITFDSIRESIGDFEPFLITTSHGKDLSFIELQQSLLSTTDFDVGGNPFQEDGYSAFLYTERGIYRPGESLHLMAIVREAGKTGSSLLSVPPPFPLRMEIIGPDNEILHELRKETNGEGSAEFLVDLPVYIRTGSYTARAFVGNENEIGRTTFQVEEFMPDRIKVKIETDSFSYFMGKKIDVLVSAKNLFGPPAAGRRTSLNLEIQSSLFSPSKWRSFTFNDSRKEFRKMDHDVGEVELDEEGRHTFPINLPSGLTPPSSLRGILTSTVLEPGGRAVTAYHTLDLHPYSHYVGLRQVKEGYAEVNKPMEFEFILVDHNGEAVRERECEISFYREVYQTVLRKSGRGYRYVSERQENLIQTFKVISKEKEEKFNVTPDDYGSYFVVVKDPSSSSTASTSFYASGWGYAPWAMDKPERLEIDLDKPSYRPGEIAKVQIRSPFSGKLILTVEREKVVDHKIQMMSENTATLELPVSMEYKPNVYISCSVIRSTRSLERHAPVRAFGVNPLLVDSRENQLTIALDLPKEMRSKNPLKISFQVKDGRGESAGRPYLTIAAVDEGILQLTDFKNPDPFGFFFSKKRLGVKSYDLYSSVLPEVEKATTPSRPSGDGGLDGEEAERRKRLIPVQVTRVRPVSLWSGLLQTDSEGKGSVTFEIPQFNGSLRVMAVVFSGNLFGSSRGDLIVRDPIVLTPTFPRFIASKDEFIVPVSVFNGTGKEDRFEVTLQVEGPVERPSTPSQTLTLKHEKEGEVFYSLKAMEGLGKVSFNLTGRGGGFETRILEELPLRPPSPPITLTGSGVVKADEEGVFDFPGNWVEGSTEFDITVSPFPLLEFAGSLQYLLQYPYGCAEQTTSRVFPLLYFNDLARLIEPELFGTKGPDYFIEEGIEKLEDMQREDGWFSFWPRAHMINDWTSIYVTHFFVEARKAGYEVSDRVYSRMIRALEAGLRRPIPADHYWERETRAYACYVLALAGVPNKSAMLYLKNNELSKMTDYSVFHLAGGFALSGDLNTAFSLFPSTVEPKEVGRESGRNFNSSIRAKAIMLDVLAQVSPDHAAVPRLVKSLSDAASKQNRWYTTQENAFAFLALGKIVRKQEPGKYKGKIFIDGKSYRDFESKDQQFSGKDWGGKKVTLSIEGKGNCYYYWKGFGISKDPVPEYDQEIVIRRTFYSENGNPISREPFHQGDLIVAKISVKALTENLENVIITDLLPAGFEIENPRLESRAGIPWVGKDAFQPDYMDIRDDRLLLSAYLPRQQERNFYYALRVVSRGDFTLPPVVGEAMYDPVKSSVGSSGRVSVTGE